MATTYLDRTQGTGTSTTQWTISMWVKRGTLGAVQRLMMAGDSSGSPDDYLFFQADDTLKFNVTGGAGILITNRLFRDTGAWYHVVAVWDSPNDAAGDRMKLYINGVEETSFATDTNPAEDTASTGFNVSGEEVTIGRSSYSSGEQYFDGVMAHVHFCDGQVYAASDFGETDATSGIWIAKSGPSVTYGDNGFFLKFASGALGTDSSGESNDFVVSGTMTNTKDTPDNNFATMNPLVYGTSQTFSNGNNTITNSGATWEQNFATQGVSSGKWYWEAKFVSGTWVVTGVDSVIFYSPSTSGFTTTSVGYKSNNGNVAVAASIIDTEATYAPGDIVSVALDMDNDAVYFAKDGVWINSGDPTSGASKTGAYTLPVANTTYFPTMGLYNTEVDSLNFGNGYFGTTAVTSAEADGNGEGQFEYAPPTGYFALCTNNLGSES